MKTKLNTRYDYEPFLDYDNTTIDYPKQFLNYNEALEYYRLHFEYGRLIEGLECDEWVDKRENGLSLDFELDSIELSSQGQYFFGCTFDIYKNTYSERYISYLSDFPDANEIDFCNYELKKNLDYICSVKVKEKMSFSIKKRNEFLIEKIGVTKIPINESESSDLSIKTSGTQFDRCF